MKTYPYIFLLLLGLALGFGGSVQAQETMTAGVYDDTDPNISYDISLESGTGGGFYNDTWSYTDYLSFTCYCTGFSIYALSNAFSPDIDVYILPLLGGDATVLTYPTYNVSDPDVWKAVEITDLPLSAYYVDISAVSDEELDTRYTFDALEIFGASSVSDTVVFPTTTPDPTVYDHTITTDADESQVVRYQYLMTTGDIFIGLGLYSLLIVSAISLGVLLWKK